MSEKEISIKVNICDRFYPLRIKTSEEEAIRKAVKTINEKVKSYVSNYSMQDKQDALSMVSLELASDSTERDTTGVNLDNINNKLTQLEQMLDI